MKPEIVYANILGRTMRCEVIKAQSRKPHCVLLDGPQSAENFDGDEVAEWTVVIGDENGEPMDGNVRRFRDYGSAVLYAARLARNGRLELVDDSFPV